MTALMLALAQADPEAIVDLAGNTVLVIAKNSSSDEASDIAPRYVAIESDFLCTDLGSSETALQNLRQ